MASTQALWADFTLHPQLRLDRQAKVPQVSVAVVPLAFAVPRLPLPLIVKFLIT